MLYPQRYQLPRIKIKHIFLTGRNDFYVLSVGLAFRVDLTNYHMVPHGGVSVSDKWWSAWIMHSAAAPQRSGCTVLGLHCIYSWCIILLLHSSHPAQCSPCTMLLMQSAHAAQCWHCVLHSAPAAQCWHCTMLTVHSAHPSQCSPCTVLILAVHTAMGTGWSLIHIVNVLLFTVLSSTE